MRKPVGDTEPVTLARLDEATIVARVTRYSSLRGVERALLPSVRRRVRLPTTHLGNEILGRLQGLLDRARIGGHSASRVDDRTRDELARIDESLYAFASALSRMIDETPIAQLRATLPMLVERSRGEIVSLLDLCLETFVPGGGGGAVVKVDYLVTLLARQRNGDFASLYCDPCTVTPGVIRRCTAADAHPDEHAPRIARLFRDARIELLAVDDLDEIVQRMRTVKEELGAAWFDRDVLRAIVHYNIAVDNRFRELFELEHRRDAAIERTLRALSELDMATPAARDGAGSVDASAVRPGPGMRALEEALRDRLTGRVDQADVARRLAACIELLSSEAPEGVERDALGDALLRAAVVVGLALRDLPSLTSRLREVDIDVTRVKTDWVRELDEALQTAIAALAKSGRPDQAARLARTRMRYLSGH